MNTLEHPGMIQSLSPALIIGILRSICTFLEPRTSGLDMQMELTSPVPRSGVWEAAYGSAGAETRAVREFNSAPARGIAVVWGFDWPRREIDINGGDPKLHPRPDRNFHRTCTWYV